MVLNIEHFSLSSGLGLTHLMFAALATRRALVGWKLEVKGCEDLPVAVPIGSAVAIEAKRAARTRMGFMSVVGGCWWLLVVVGVSGLFLSVIVRVVKLQLNSEKKGGKRQIL